MRRFDSCALCLASAREPLACNEGHLFCKECAYTDLCECLYQGDTLLELTIVSDAEKGHQTAESQAREDEA